MTSTAREPAGRRSFWRRWRGPLVIVPLVAALVVAGALGARMLLADPSAGDGSAGGATVTCWDGTQQPRSRCGLPAGEAGLRYVFPQFRPGGGRCDEVPHRATGGLPAPVEWTCRVATRGEQVAVTYVRRSSTGAGLAAVRALYPGVRAQPVAGGERLRYRATSPDGSGRLTATEVYARLPYSVSVAADTSAVRDAVLAGVRFRPAAYVSVRPPAPQPPPRPARRGGTPRG